MGAWGHGILQNDDVQDALCGVLGDVTADLRKLRRRPDEPVAARAGAAVGVLLQLSASSWFAEGNEDDWPAIRAVLERQRPAFDKLPPAAARLLDEVLAGKGAELAGREAPTDEPLARALYGDLQDGFATERKHGLREPSLFEHPEARRYVQEVADRLVNQADRGFDDDELIARFDDGDGFEPVACVAVLLVLGPCRVDPERFASWRARVRAGLEETGDADDPFYECLELAFTLGIQKFSAP
jgi:hypothetical protein